MACTRTTIASIRPPVSSAWAGNGGITFADGHYAVLFADPNIPGTIYSGNSKTMRKGDRVSICISVKPKHCPPNRGHRQIVVQDLDRPAKFPSTTRATGMARSLQAVIAPVSTSIHIHVSAVHGERCDGGELAAFYRRATCGDAQRSHYQPFYILYLRSLR